LTIRQRYDIFILMARRAKIACSIDAALLARVESIRLVTGETRSAVIGRALTKLTSDETRTEQVRRYRAAYLEQPEAAHEIEVARQHARRTLARLPWNDALRDPRRGDK
jgi:metal-responsive CopG/Arc/MetJ family transcriptional regulator